MHGATLIALREVVQELGRGSHAGNQQMISRSGAGNVEQLALGVIDFLQIRVIADRLDTFLQGYDFIVACHHDHGPKLQTFGEVHSAD
jgi:hypothetical protein